MAEDRNKWLDGVLKMIQLTQEGKLTWEPAYPSDSLKQLPDDEIDRVFAASYKDHNLRLFRRKFKSYLPTRPFDVLSSGTMNSLWVSKTVLGFVDEAGKPLGTYPEMDALDDLWSAVEFQVSKTKNFLDSILQEP